MRCYLIGRDGRLVCHGMHEQTAVWMIDGEGHAECVVGLPPVAASDCGTNESPRFKHRRYGQILKKMELETICFSSESSWFQVSRKIRVQVFVEEQGFSLGDEFDEIEETSVHVLFSLSSRPNEQIGTLRYDPTKGKISRIALLPAYRGSGIGREMMLSFERRLLAGLQLVLLADHQAAPSSLSLILSDLTPPSQIRLHSQIPVIGFYAKIGYQSIGPTFIEDGAPHQLMVKELQSSSSIQPL